MNENSSRFKLAFSSPLLKSPLLDQLGICGDTEAAQSLLNDSATVDASDLAKILSLFHKDNNLNIPLALLPSD